MNLKHYGWICINTYRCQKRLDNLLWVFAPDASREYDHAIYYPGADFVDIVGVDYYGGTNLNTNDVYDTLINAVPDKPVGLTEYGADSSNMCEAPAPNSTNANLINIISNPLYSRISFFQVWHRPWAIIANRNTSDMLLKYPSVINRNEILFNSIVCPDNDGMLNWSGFKWWVRQGIDEPPPKQIQNDWRNSCDNVWVDSRERLHLKVTEHNDNWYCSEINLHSDDPNFPLGHGEYHFYIDNDVTQLDKNIVAGFFTYDSGACDSEACREIDIEISKRPPGTLPGEPGSTDPAGNNIQFLTQKAGIDIMDRKYMQPSKKKRSYVQLGQFQWRAFSFLADRCSRCRLLPLSLP